MIQNPRPIAILLAAYNAEKYIDEQIQSLLAQTNTEWTLYIRNDGSTDTTQMVIDRYTNQYPGKIVQIDPEGKNLGCRANFFRLLEAIESEYYMFCDADDVWLNEKIELSYSLLREKELRYPNMPLLVHTDKVVCDEHLNVMAASWWKAVGLNPDLFHKLCYIPISPVVGGATSIFNRRGRDQCLPIPPDPPQHDCWVPFQTAKYGKIFALHHPLILYRQHQNNSIGAPTEPYRFQWNKLGQVAAIVRRDRQLARYFNRLGYGGTGKYFFTRILVLFKLQWSKITYR